MGLLSGIVKAKLLQRLVQSLTSRRGSAGTRRR